MKTDEKNPQLTYADAGVNIAAGNSFVQQIKPLVSMTRRSEVLNSLGGYNALFELPLSRYREPILVSSTDGVGTKLKLAIELNKHDTIGIDLVAMCVNDIVVSGAEPLFFLDYFATSSLDQDQAHNVIKGIAQGCLQAGAALVGGETAEMPGLYNTKDYDLAGFCVGVVDKPEIIDGSKIKPGDTLIALASSGPHSNGFSLIRKILTVKKANLAVMWGERQLGEILLEPTKIYVKSILQLRQSQTILGIAHITGGGITENLPRILPHYTQALIDTQSWRKPPIFQWLQEQGNIEETEMLRTFNCGVGMIICIPKIELHQTLALLNQYGESAWQIGEIRAHQDREPNVVFI